MEIIETGDDSDGTRLQRPTSNHVAYGLDRYSYQQGENAQFGFSILEDEEPALVAKGGGAQPVAIPEGDTCASRY